MSRFVRTLKLGMIFSISIAMAVAVMHFAFLNIVEKTGQEDVKVQLEKVNGYLKHRFAETERLAEVWASGTEIPRLFVNNSSKNRKKILRSKQINKEQYSFFALMTKNNKIFFSRRIEKSETNSEKKMFSKLDSKTTYQISTVEFIKTLTVTNTYRGFIYSDQLYLIIAEPVYTDEDGNNSIGYLIIGQALEEQQLSKDNLIDVSVEPVNPAIDQHQKRILTAAKSKNIIQDNNKSEVVTRLLVRSVADTPVAFITNKKAKPEILYLYEISWFSVLLIIFVAAMLAYLFWWYRKTGLCKSLKLLEEDIQSVKIGSELSSRLSRTSRGILDGVVLALNQKIGGFEQTFVDNRKHNAEIILNELPLEAYLKDTACKYVAVNEKYCNSLGLDRGSIIGKHNSDIGAITDSELINKKENEVVSTKEAIIFEESEETKNNGEVIYSIHLIPFINAKGLVEGIVGVRIDITDQKKAADEMEMAAKVLENTAEGFMVTDADRYAVHVNTAYTEMTGYSESELLGKVPLLLQTESRSKTYQEIQRKLDQDGSWSGELWSSRKNGTSYPEMINIKAIRNKKGEVTNYFSMSKDITEEKKWEQRLYDMAHYDGLTGLPNRTLFQDRLSQEIARCERSKRNIAILFLDIDLFKGINDSLGHAAGDELLKAISNRLKLTLRSVDSIARMGGDEFTILVTDLAIDYKKNIGYLKSLSEKIIDVVGQPIELEGREINVTCSIGIAVYPVDASSVEDLIRNADSAMYYAKSQGRRNYQFYSKGFNEAAVERLEKEIELRAALKNTDLQLYFQPQIDVISRHVVGAEALLRWTKDGETVLGPEKIITIAEEMGLINELGNWILKSACTECKSWLDQGHKNLRVAVNLSTRQFRQKNLVDIVSGILEETKLPGRLLELEVTESALMESVEYSIEMMAELSRLGVRWSLDDFGTGYSSLNYLRDFPVHVLKVDQSFVREITINPEDAAIVETIIDLAHKLHLTVIAEGVENEEQLKVLSRMNCEQVQGYYFSKPEKIEGFLDYVNKGIKA